MKVTIVYSELEQVQNVKDDDFIMLDENSYKTRKKAFREKAAIGARQTPLVIVKSDEGDYLYVFYKEEFDDPIAQFYKMYEDLKTKQK